MAKTTLIYLFTGVCGANAVHWQEGSKADQRVLVPRRDRKALLVTAALAASHPAHLVRKEGGRRQFIFQATFVWNKGS